MNSYELSRGWFDFSFNNPEMISPNHTAIYFFAIEHCNRLGWKEKFGFPTQMAMDALGIKKHQTYIRYFNDLVNWGFFILVQKSTNQYSANIISINCAMPKNGKALDKAIITHTAKQTEPIGQSNSSIDKQDNNITINKETSVYRSFKHLSISIEQYEKLKKDYYEHQIENILDAIENRADNKKYTSLYLTAKTWLNKEPKRPQVRKL